MGRMAGRRCKPGAGIPVIGDCPPPLQSEIEGQLNPDEGISFQLI
jgi:hypothetical protein